MSLHGKHLPAALIAVVAVALLLPLSNAAGGGSAGAPRLAAPAALDAAVTPSPATATAAPGTSSAVGDQVLSTLRSSDVPMSEVFLPNFNSRIAQSGDQVSPLYGNSPAPMGLGDFGIQEEGGVNVGTISYTSSVRASVTFDSLEPLYLDAAGPDQFTVQANTVLTNVNVLGTTGNQYWIQNVPVYYASEDLLVFEDNIWNFSNPYFNFPSNGIYAHGPLGAVYGNEVYIGIGEQEFTIAPPFTVTTYNNATLLDGRPAVFFNYTLTQHGVSVSGSYDFAVFNSSGAVAAPTYQINGQAPNPTGFLLNDAEIMLGGPGGGSETNFLGFSGGMTLATLPNGSATYQDVPSAFDFGTDTGETSAGIAEYSTGGAHPSAVLGSGPSLLYPLWGVAGAVSPGAASYSFNLHPSNAFVFVSPGRSFNDSAAAWAPVPTSGLATYLLPPGQYSFEFLLSDYAPAATTLTGGSTRTETVSLSYAPREGVYTPLWALDNAQLAAISSSGRGTQSDPYVLFNNQQGLLNPLFGEFNDYFFPVFAGIFLVDTSAYVSVYNAPSFEFQYAIQPEAATVAAYGLPSVNFLEQNYYGVSHVSIVSNRDITGWIDANDAGFTEASVVFWNSSDNLIAGNTFGVMSQALILFGGTSNVIWGNDFLPVQLPNSVSSGIGYNGSTFALELWESGDLIYNNVFDTPITAYTPTFNIYNGAPSLYVDQWNVPKQPTFDVLWVNGWGLSGNILGLNYEGGNYWWNYGTPSDPTGVLPYNNGGLITVGGDYLPLVPAPHHHY
jgi:thermopsin